MKAAWEIYESKARYTVVGQIYYSGGYLDHEDAAANKVGFGRYATENQAQAAAESLVFGARTHEESRAWVLRVHHGTPASYYAERAEERKRAEMAGKTGLEARLQRRLDWFKLNPGALTLPADIDSAIEHCATCGHVLAEEA